MKRTIFIIFLLMLCGPVFAAGSLINEDTVHFVGQASAFTVGAELVTDGGFPTLDNWTEGTWTLATGVVSEDNAGGNSDITQNITGLTDGRLYRIQFEVTAYTDGNVAARFDNVELGDKGSTGVFTGYAVATGTDANVTIRADATFTGSVDNVKVVAWVGDLDAGAGSTIAAFTGTLTDYMSATGGVLHNDGGLALSDAGGNLIITAAGGGAWDTTPQVGTLVNCDFSATYTDGIYAITAVTNETITIDTEGFEPSGSNVEVWIGGAFPDIANALNASTLSEDPDGIYRKRYICVNVDQQVDAVTNFVAESSETAHREDDGSRKIIGFYDSISVVNPGEGGGTYGYRIVSDCDEGQQYYGGALGAFQFDEGFTITRPDAFTIVNLVTNGTFDNWAGSSPDETPTGWQATAGTANREVQEVGAGNFHGGAGSGALNIWTDNDTLIAFAQNTILTPGVMYRIKFDMWDNGGSIILRDFTDTVSVATFDGTGSKEAFFAAIDAGILFRRSGNTDITIDNVTVTEVVHPGWISWDAQGNTTNILELNTSSFEMRNIKIHNTAVGGTYSLTHIDTALFNPRFINCWFGTAERFAVNDTPIAIGAMFSDCYFDDAIVAPSLVDYDATLLVNSIVNLAAATDGLTALGESCVESCLFYGGLSGMRNVNDSRISNSVFYGQTVECVKVTSAIGGPASVMNNIFSPVAAADIGISFTDGSRGPSFNNIFYSVAAGVVLTNPISHDQITPNPPLPVGSLEVDPQFVNPADGDFRLRASSPALNGGRRSLFNGYTTIGANGPYSSPNAGYRPRYNFKGHNYSDR